MQWSLAVRFKTEQIPRFVQGPDANTVMDTGSLGRLPLVLDICRNTSVPKCTPNVTHFTDK
jgi:hypothetical protein